MVGLCKTRVFHGTVIVVGRTKATALSTISKAVMYFECQSKNPKWFANAKRESVG